MNINDKENRLFYKWSKELNEFGTFAKDGAGINFQDAKIKVLFLMKETNDTKGDWDTRDYLNTGVLYKKTKINEKTKRKEHTKGKPISKTFNNIYTWSKLFIEDLDKYKKPPSENNIDERIKIFSSIVVMNLKKISGKAVTNIDELKKFVEKDEKFIQQQIKIYSTKYIKNTPFFIICCGKGVYNSYIKVMGEFENNHIVLEGFRTNKSKDGCIVIDFYHPQPRGVEFSTIFNQLKIIKEFYLH